MVLRKWLFFFSVWGFLPVEGAEASFSREGYVVSYKVVENEFSTSERSVMDVCPECLSGDRTAEEIKLLSTSACEQVVKSEQCREVEPKYLRDCEEEEEEGTLAFGQRVLGCMKGAALEGAIGWGIGAVIGKAIVGIGALLSVPFVAPALGIAAGGGATLYAFIEYDKAYREVEEGDGKALRATGQMFGNIGTGIYRLFLGNYECYNPQGRAWEVCGLLLGGVAGGGAAIKGSLFSGLTEPQRGLLLKAVGKEFYAGYVDIADLRKAGISMDKIKKAFRWLQVKPNVKKSFEESVEQLEKAKILLGQTEDLSERQVRGVNDLVHRSLGWEQIVQGMRKTGLSAVNALSLRREARDYLVGKNKYIDIGNLQRYIKKREAVEKSIGHRFTEKQGQTLVRLQTEAGMGTFIGREQKLGVYIKELIESGLSPRQIRDMVDSDLITYDVVKKKILNSVIP